ncbi:MAG: hypothetical protein DMD80_13905 [Candidatus Rokuibacteriota bacterium]|nr:MAG: hypothetical protein DMD80_13905 [Candidatus Rokubacteria bacterium]
MGELRLDESYWRELLGGAWSRGWRPTHREQTLHEARYEQSEQHDPRARLAELVQRRQRARGVAYSQAMVEVRAENPALSERVERFYLSEDDLSDRAMARALFWAEVARAMRVNVISEREAVGLVARNSEGLYRSAFSS